MHQVMKGHTHHVFVDGSYWRKLYVYFYFYFNFHYIYEGSGRGNRILFFMQMELLSCPLFHLQVCVSLHKSLNRELFRNFK